jgi:IPT/TIG domain
MVPAGVGAGYLFSVAASSVYGEATGFLYSYHPPVITSVSPVRCFVSFSLCIGSDGCRDLQATCPSTGCVLTISGSNFGVTPLLEPNETFALLNRTVSVGDQPCLPSVWSNTEILCAIGPGIAAVGISLNGFCQVCSTDELFRASRISRLSSLFKVNEMCLTMTWQYSATNVRLCPVCHPANMSRTEVA